MMPDGENTFRRATVLVYNQYRSIFDLVRFVASTYSVSGCGHYEMLMRPCFLTSKIERYCVYNPKTGSRESWYHVEPTADWRPRRSTDDKKGAQNCQKRACFRVWRAKVQEITVPVPTLAAACTKLFEYQRPRTVVTVEGPTRSFVIQRSDTTMRGEFAVTATCTSPATRGMADRPNPRFLS